MNEVKIEHITTSHGDTFEITDASGNHVTLNPEEALLCLQFLYERVDEITRLVNGLETSEPERNFWLESPDEDARQWRIANGMEQ